MYIIQNPKTGKFIQLDIPSGGYPFETEWYNAKFWTSLEEAKKYREVFVSPSNIYNTNINSKHWKIMLVGCPTLEWAS